MKEASSRETSRPASSKMAFSNFASLVVMVDRLSSSFRRSNSEGERKKDWRRKGVVVQYRYMIISSNVTCNEGQCRNLVEGKHRMVHESARDKQSYFLLL